MEKLWLSRSWHIASKRWLSVGAVLVVAALLALSGCAAASAEQTTPAAAPGTGSVQDDESGSSSGWDLSMQQNSAGRVEIDVTPLALQGDVWQFQVALNTHSVNLDYDLTKVGALRCDRGQEFEAIAWDGSGPGGHHRSGVLEFAALDHPTSSVELVIRDVDSVPERVFKWDLPSETEARAGSTEAQSVSSQPSSPAGDQPASVTLSDQVFYFGDVVMSQGVVERTIEITNAGTGVLRIEGIDPT